MVPQNLVMNRTLHIELNGQQIEEVMETNSLVSSLIMA